MIKLATLVALLLVVSGMTYVRLAPIDPTQWHEDPRLVARPATPNFHLIRLVGGDAMPQVFAQSVPELAQRLDQIARADGARLVAGSVASGHMTYLTRTRWMGFPDFTSILIEQAGDNAMLLAFARARFGHSDMGANRARLERWLSALDA